MQFNRTGATCSGEVLLPTCLTTGAHLRPPRIEDPVSFGIFLFCLSSRDFAGIARVAEFTGEAVILSGFNMDEVKTPGQSVKGGDMVQTQQGAVQLAFDNGTLLKINPYTTVTAQDRAQDIQESLMN
jgi:hypothetical protein